jgi:hypothetical protein
METKTISQKPERYSKKGNDWVISAKADSIDGNIKPVTLTPSSLPFTLKPLIKTDGVIVNVDDIYLVSQKTLDIINQSNNPHYDLKVNGVILWKGTNIQMGNTIPIVKIKISNLTDIAADRDTKNKNAGVSYVDYIYEGESIDGVPINLIKQIDYTLMPDEQRPEDKFGVWSLNLGDDTTIYSIDTLKIQTAQEDGKLDKNKLSTFLTNISERLKILRNDFNMIKDVFYNAKTPDNVGTYDVSLMAQTNPPEEIQPVVFKYTTLIEVKDNPQQLSVTNNTNTTNG